MDAVPAFLGLFVTSLIAGTFLPFLPGSSEMAMAGLLAIHAAPAAALYTTAVVANVLGAAINYWVGRNVANLVGRRWFPLSQTSVDKATTWFQRYGVWALVMCWLPTFGDAITVVSGLLRTDVRLFMLLVLLGKMFGHGIVALGMTWLT